MAAGDNTVMRSNLALYYSARFTGQVGHYLFMAALFVIAGSGGHSAMGLSSLIIATTVSAIAFGLPAGALADRLGPGRGFAIGAGLRASIAAIALFTGPSATAVIALAFAYSAVSQLHGTSEMALVKALCHRSPGRVHSLLVAMQYLGQALGYLVLAPTLYLLGGVQLAIAGALVIQVFHIGLTSFLAYRLRNTAREESMATSRGHFSGLRQTLSVFGHSAPARDALAVLSLKSLVSYVILVAFPLYLKHDLSLGTGGAALLLAPGIAGAAVGLVWSAVGLSLDGTARAMRLSIAGMTVAVFALAALDFGVSAAFVYSQVPPLVHFEAALNTTAVVAMPLAFLIGATLSVSMVSSRAALTAAAPLRIQSRVFAVQATASDALVILPLLFAGVFAELFGARTTLASLGTLCGLTGLAMWHPWFRIGVLARRGEVTDLVAQPLLPSSRP